jgi:TRAP-type C4-dicarboxylate transport system permease small subunit
VTPRAGGRATSVAARFEAALGALLGALIFAMMALTFVDVVGRYAFDAPLSGVYEITTLLLGAVVYLALPLTTAREEHVTLSFLRSLFGPRLKAIQLALVNLFGAATLVAIAWRLLVQADKLADMGNRIVFLNLPLAPVVYLMSTMALVAGLLHLGLALRYAGRSAAKSPHPGP